VSKLSKTTVREVFNQVVSSDTSLSSGHWTHVRDLFSVLEVKDDVTPAEAITISRADILVQPDRALTQTLADDDLMPALIRIANAVSNERSPAAILYRRLLVSVDQRLPKGKDLSALM
jgi:hypothetical protein